MVTLHPFQRSALRQVSSLVAQGTRTVLYSPTGSGKSVMAVYVALRGLAVNKRVLFVVHRTDLVAQQADRFAEYGQEVGILQGENSRHVQRPLVIASVQTWAKRHQNIGDFDIILIDECHRVPGSLQYHELFKACDGKTIIGFTATPFSIGLSRYFDDMVISSTIAGLIDTGYLVDLDIYAPSEPDLEKVRIVAGDWHKGDAGAAVDKPSLVGDIVETWLKLAAGKPTLLFAHNIAHSKHIVTAFERVNVAAQHLDCYTETNKRQDVIAAFKRGEFQVLSNVALFSEGFDAPNAEVMILARPTRSLIRYIQMAGRVLRPFAGKDKALLLDHSGTVRRLGFPTDDLPLALDDGKSPPKAEPEKKVKLPVPCGACGFVDPECVRPCVKCGFMPERQNKTGFVEGNLQKLKRSKKESILAETSKQDIYSSLITMYNRALAAGKTWKNGWVAAMYKDITGVWPRGLDWIPATEPHWLVVSFVKHQQIKYAKSKHR